MSTNFTMMSWVLGTPGTTLVGKGENTSLPMTLNAAVGADASIPDTAAVSLQSVPVDELFSEPNVATPDRVSAVRLAPADVKLPTVQVLVSVTSVLSAAARPFRTTATRSAVGDGFAGAISAWVETTWLT